jgi:DNA-binding transcriptional LysR family regulator
MNQIDLRQFDLNLLVVFDVLMTEWSVTRAAERLGRTQSAVSHSLSRLREQFGDPLLTKGGARMQPTALALNLIEQARPMLGGIQRVLSPQQMFDPKSSSRVFRLAAPDGPGR